jgi:hypothetical protein
MAPHFDVQQIFGPHGLLAQALSHYEERPQQEEMSVRVWDALQARQTLLVEAGTGTGKTLAYLIPAIQSGLKVVVSTGTKKSARADLLQGHPLPAAGAPASLQGRLHEGAPKLPLPLAFAKTPATASPAGIGGSRLVAASGAVG